MRSPVAHVTDEQLRAAATEVAEAFALDLVVLFGSAVDARDTAEDLDVGVRAAHPLDVIAITNALTHRLGVQCVDVADLRTADPLLLMLAARDGVALFERTPSSFAAFTILAAGRYADTEKFRRDEHDALHAFIREHRRS